MSELDSLIIKFASGFLVSLLGMAVRALFSVAKDVRELKYQCKEALERHEELDNRVVKLEKKTEHFPSRTKPRN